MGGYQLFCVNKDARTIVFIKKVLISNRNRSRRSFFVSLDDFYELPLL